MTKYLRHFKSNYGGWLLMLAPVWLMMVVVSEISYLTNRPEIRSSLITCSQLIIGSRLQDKHLFVKGLRNGIGSSEEVESELAENFLTSISDEEWRLLKHSFLSLKINGSRLLQEKNFSRIYYELGRTAYLNHKYDLTRKLWVLANITAKPWSYYYMELASLSHELGDDYSRDEWLVKCNDYESARTHCRELHDDITSGRITPLFFYATIRDSFPY